MTGVMPPSKPEEEGVFAQGTPTPSGHYHPISVIIPTYNRQKWLEEILASIAVQTLPVEQFEVIVVDDGSKDGTREVAHKAYPFRLRYFYQTNQGDAAARNLGAKHSEAEFLVFWMMILFWIRIFWQTWWLNIRLNLIGLLWGRILCGWRMPIHLRLE